MVFLGLNGSKMTDYHQLVLDMLMWFLFTRNQLNQLLIIAMWYSVGQWNRQKGFGRKFLKLQK